MAKQRKYNPGIKETGRKVLEVSVRLQLGADHQNAVQRIKSIPGVCRVRQPMPTSRNPVSRAVWIIYIPWRPKNTNIDPIVTELLRMSVVESCERLGMAHI